LRHGAKGALVFQRPDRKEQFEMEKRNRLFVMVLVMAGLFVMCTSFPVAAADASSKVGIKSAKISAKAFESGAVKLMAPAAGAVESADRLRTPGDQGTATTGNKNTVKAVPGAKAVKP